MVRVGYGPISSPTIQAINLIVNFKTIEKLRVRSGWESEKSRMAGTSWEAIYKQNGMIIDALSQTNYDNQRISKTSM